VRSSAEFHAEAVGLQLQGPLERWERVVLAAADRPQVGRIDELAGQLSRLDERRHLLEEFILLGPPCLESYLQPVLERDGTVVVIGLGGAEGWGGIRDGRGAEKQQREDERHGPHVGASGRTIAEMRDRLPLRRGQAGFPVAREASNRAGAAANPLSAAAASTRRARAGPVQAKRAIA
jgi:hypothetical protein